jgi:two-component system, LytTR family, sensor kinase
MRKHNCKIGFDDRMVMIIAIPILSFIIPIVFMSCRFGRYPFFTWDKFLTTLIITTILWTGNRGIMIYCRSRYPLFKDVKKRLVFQSISMLSFTIVFNNLLGYLFDCIIFSGSSQQHFGVDKLISTNSAAIFCTIMIMAIYESVYFMHELRASVEEAEKLKRESLHAQLSALKTQVNPHFLFNNLNTLSSLIPENPEHAVDFVQELSKVYRYILEVKDEKTILLKDEMEVFNAYTFLLQTRFDKNLSVDIDIAEEKLLKKVVPLSLQILMENAIKHNVVSSEKPLHIRLFTDNGSLVISNNLQIKNQINESTGIGLDNIRNRYKLISQKLVTVVENDTNFTVSIPLIDN